MRAMASSLPPPLSPQFLTGATSKVITALPGKPRIYFYATQDIVSDVIDKGQVWEEEDINQILWAMEQPLPDDLGGSEQDQLQERLFDRASTSLSIGKGRRMALGMYKRRRRTLMPGAGAPPEAAKPGSTSAGSRDGLFVDIGANIGWFSASLASRGYKVAAFEGEFLPASSIFHGVHHYGLPSP